MSLVVYIHLERVELLILTLNKQPVTNLTYQTTEQLRKVPMCH